MTYFLANVAQIFENFFVVQSVSSLVNINIKINQYFPFLSYKIGPLPASFSLFSSFQYS